MLLFSHCHSIKPGKLLFRVSSCNQGDRLCGKPGNFVELREGQRNVRNSVKVMERCMSRKSVDDLAVSLFSKLSKALV